MKKFANPKNPKAVGENFGAKWILCKIFSVSIIKIFKIIS